MLTQTLNFDLPNPGHPNYQHELDIKLREILRTMQTEINRTTGSQWDGFHPIWGGNHVWVDSSNNLRIKSDIPLSETDGTVVVAFA